MLSIITPNLNNAAYLEANIRGIMELAIPFEHIIVDGGSTDGSLDLISNFPHIKLISQFERTGMYGAIDMGIRASEGKYIGYVNADDKVVIDGFKAMYKQIDFGKYDVVYSDGIYDFVRENKKELGKGRRFGKFFLKHGIMPAIQPSIIFTKNIYNKIGGLRFEKFKICGDLDLFLRMANVDGSKFKYVPKVSTIFMKRGDSLGDKNHDQYLREIKENAIPTPNLFDRALYRIFKYI